nr:unnamed protein product [Spirometra erinaceieuropaei]
MIIATALLFEISPPAAKGSICDDTDIPKSHASVSRPSDSTHRNFEQQRGDLIKAFRIVRNQGCCLASGDFFDLATTTNLRGHPLKLRVTGARLDTRKFFFSNRVVAALESLA